MRPHCQMEVFIRWDLPNRDWVLARDRAIRWRDDKCPRYPNVLNLALLFASDQSVFKYYRQIILLEYILRHISKAGLLAWTDFRNEQKNLSDGL